MIDWDAIEDRLRRPQRMPDWPNPASIMQAAIDSYRLPRWDSQDAYVELWVEKDALAGVLRPIADDLHVTLMVNRGYSSQSAMKESAQRFYDANRLGMACKLFYIGDMDPSGEDMVRDVADRLDLLTYGAYLDVVKLAITEEQVAQYTPPPNPTKMSDTRAQGFVARFGTASYEADALPPNALAQVARDAIEAEIDYTIWNDVLEAEERDKDLLRQASQWVMEHRDE